MHFCKITLSKLRASGHQRSLSFGLVNAAIALTITQPVWAAETIVTRIPLLSEHESSSTSATDLIAQEDNASQTAAITGVKLNLTATGLEVFLETTSGDVLQPTTRNEGNTLIAEIDNTLLKLPEGEPFQAENPVAGITAVTVTQVDTNRIQVRITGEAAIPTAEVKPSPNGILLGVTPAPDEEELVVTGEQDTGYRVPNATTATKTDTPIRDIPQSIQVIPKQVIEDQGVQRISDAVRNVSGVSPTPGYGGASNNYTIRGFQSFRIFRDGFSNSAAEIPFSTANIERVEVLKGPASVLYGQLEPGGIVNYVTKQPLDKSYYAVEFSAGSYDYYRPAIDFSGPLTNDGKLLYRLNVAYENSGSFRDFGFADTVFVSPVLTYNFSPKTSLTLNFEYQDVKQFFDRGFAPGFPYQDLPISFNTGEPSDRFPITSLRGGYTFKHRFNDSWSLRNAFYVDSSKGTRDNVQPETFEVEEDGRTLRRVYTLVPQYQDNYSLQTELTGKFKTGFAEHQVLFGFDYTEANIGFRFQREPFTSLDIFDPVYQSEPLPTTFTDSDFSSNSDTDSIGIYLQDQITLLPNLKFLVGGRFDIIKFKNRDVDFLDTAEGVVSKSDYDAFTPRLGIVYQPIEQISLYASYSRSFNPNTSALDINRQPLEPERGTQYEIGVKAELLDKKLSATLAAYNITKSNVATPDPNDPDEIASIAAGEVKSRGIELDLTGEVLPGWKFIASYAFNNAFVSKDNSIPVGDKLSNAPRHTASLWTTYEIQRGTLNGLGFGAGLFFLSDREIELPNTESVPSYLRADAVLYYRRDNWRAAVNFKNISNTQYYDAQGFALIYPGAPFTVLGTISAQF
jgi:iron complex outermembrane recepter protein